MEEQLRVLDAQRAELLQKIEEHKQPITRAEVLRMFEEFRKEILQLISVDSMVSASGLSMTNVIGATKYPESRIDEERNRQVEQLRR